MVGNEGTTGAPAEQTAQLEPRSELPGLFLEVIEGPMDGVVFAGEAAQVNIGRNLDNALCLHGDIYASGLHLLLRWDTNPGTLVLEDQNSSNGTFVEGGQLVAPYPILLGSSFVAGHLSVIRTKGRDGESGRQISPEGLFQGKLQLYDSASPRLRQALAAAAMLAVRELRGFINDRHLFLGLAMGQADMPLFRRGKGPVPHEFLDHILHHPEDWTGVEPWVARHLEERKFKNFFAVELPWSPRVVWSLRAAAEEAKRRGATTIEPLDWFRAVLRDAECRTYKVLEHNGLAPAQLREELLGVPVELAQAVPAVPGTHSLEAPEMPESTSPRPVVVSSGHDAVDDKAQALARQLYGLNAYYFLAEPADRRQAMQNVLRQELGQLEPKQRRPLLEQLQRLFPLDEGAPDQVREMERLNNKIRQLEQRISELEVSQGPLSAGIPWHLVVEQHPTTAVDSLSPVDRPRIEFLREVFGFTLNTERFIVGLAQSMTSSGTTVTGSLSLPGQHKSLKGYLNDMDSGRQVRMSQLQGYLQEMEFWLLAGITAYSEGPRVWFKGFWDKASPTVIERSFSGWTRTVGLQHRELWQRYKDVTRHLTVDLASQGIFHETKQIAVQRHQQMLAERREPT